MKVTKTQLVELKLTGGMQKYFDSLCDYRRYIWNQALASWQELYQIRQMMLPAELKKKNRELAQAKRQKRKPKVQLTEEEKELNHLYPAPTWQGIKKELLDNKHDWETFRSARIVALACMDLNKAWQNFFNPELTDWGMPKFKSKKAPRQGFKSDRVKIIDGKIRLDKPTELNKYLKDHELNWWHDLSAYEELKMTEVQTCSFYKEKGHYYAALVYQEEVLPKAKTGKENAVDVNVGHFDSLEGKYNVLPAKLFKEYEKIACYNRLLAKKRVVNGEVHGRKSKRYAKVRTKLQRAYTRASRIQYELVNQFTHHLVTDYDRVVIENLDVKKMAMGIASKGVHRSLFGEFKRQMKYKFEWYGKELILADQLYPSTQRCSSCGLVKKGDEKITLKGNKKHGTKHNEYVCYNPDCPNYNQIVDRDTNAVMNLLVLIKQPELNTAL